MAALDGAIHASARMRLSGSEQKITQFQAIMSATGVPPSFRSCDPWMTGTSPAMTLSEAGTARAKFFAPKSRRRRPASAAGAALTLNQDRGSDEAARQSGKPGEFLGRKRSCAIVSPEPRASLPQRPALPTHAALCFACKWNDCGRGAKPPLPIGEGGAHRRPKSC